MFRVYCGEYLNISGTGNGSVSHFLARGTPRVQVSKECEGELMLMSLRVSALIELMQIFRGYSQ